jgi:hypothetical protein
MLRFSPLRRFIKHREGAAAVEFAILSLPFLGLVFAILSSAYEQFLINTMDRAVMDISVGIRTGAIQLTNLTSPESVSNLVCNRIKVSIDCSKLQISLWSKDCRNNGNCWASEGYGQSDDSNPAFAAGLERVRKRPVLGENSFLSDVGGNTVSVYKERYSNYLIVAYPLSNWNLFWDALSSVRDGTSQTRAAVSVGMWINDPSVQYM